MSMSVLERGVDALDDGLWLGGGEREWLGWLLVWETARMLNARRSRVCKKGVVSLLYAFSFESTQLLNMCSKWRMAGFHVAMLI